MKIKNILFLSLLLPGFFGGDALAEVPIKKTFTITGYYSPLPNQKFYVTGDYASEIRLNGRGIVGADGTGVYPGMMAGPRSMAFGTRICVPNFGCGTIHDRGQAIVNQGERNIARHDRLDLWMGYGEEGLIRALAWGLRHVECDFYGENSSIAESVNFDLPLALHDIITVPEKYAFEKNLTLGSRGELVKDLQEKLKQLHFYGGEITSVFDEALKEAVFMFQKKNFILDSWEEYGAGSFGPQTRERLTQALYHDELQRNIARAWESFHFSDVLRKGLRNEAVLKLQQMLVQRELLDVMPTAYFGPQTVKAVKSFQLQHKIIEAPSDPGAGRVGPITMMKLNDLLDQDEVAVAEEKTQVSAYQKWQQRWRVVSRKPLQDVLRYGWLRN